MNVDMVFIPVNMGGDHWILVRVDFRTKKIWLYDSLVEFCDDKTYKEQFKPFEVIFPRWLENVGFYNIRQELRSADPRKLVAVKGVPQQEPGSGDCGVFLLMFMIYLMFRLKFNFNSSQGEYFRKKIAVDIFNDDIDL